MAVLDRVKAYLKVEDRDALLEELIAQAKDFAVQYCHLPQYGEQLDSVVVKMVVEDFNRYGAEGIAARGYSGISESYLTDYSAQTLSALNKFRKIRVI